MKRNLLFIIALFACVLSFAQGELDAYRYSNSDLSGTARGQAMGGAFGALGGDVTGVAINPAGIGVYRSSEVLVNMSLSSPFTGGKSFQQSNTKFSFDNLSYIVYYPLVNGSMLSLNFGFNYNRIKSYNQLIGVSGPDIQSSLTDYMELLTNGVDHNLWLNGIDYMYDHTNVGFLSILAFDGGLINPILGTGDQYRTILDDGEKVRPRLNASEKGKVENYDFTIGSNIADKLYWGATITITDLSYLMSSAYKEDFLGEEGGGFDLVNDLETKGSGFQMKAGTIYKPTDVLRFGLAYHSPVWYTMTDYYSAALTPHGIYDLGSGKALGRTETPYEYYNYQLRTPWSWTASVAAVLGAQAIVSIDYENKNYGDMILKDERGYDFRNDNEYIREDYKNASTVRAGFEYKFTPQYSVRLGYAFSQNPYKKSMKNMGIDAVTSGSAPHYTIDGDVNYMTIGIGYRFTPQFYVDCALVHRSQNNDLYYFPPVDTSGSGLDSFQGKGSYTNQSLKGLLTLGYKF